MVARPAKTVKAESGGSVSGERRVYPVGYITPIPAAASD